MEYPATLVLDWMANYFWPIRSHLSHVNGDVGDGCAFCIYTSASVSRFSDYFCGYAGDSQAVPDTIELLSFEGFMTLF